MSLSVSVIIPAYNAATTISKTLQSMIGQSCPNWEAIVVDDGSTDNSIEIIRDFIKRDNRIRLICQENRGVAAARNNGIKAAQFDWLLFLDSDDWVADTLLERIAGVLAGDSKLDAVHFGWCLVAPDGTTQGEKFAYPLEDMFPQFAGGCVFPIHACIIRKELVTAVGGFDMSFRLCADWDFWQRVCRCGVCFGSVSEALAYYQMQQNSLSRSVEESFNVALRIIGQGYEYDSRLVNCLPQYIKGADKQQLPLQKLYCTIWYAGLMIGRDKSVKGVLDLLKGDCAATLDPKQVAEYIFESVCYSTCQSTSAWIELWGRHRAHIYDFVSALEKKSRSCGLTNNAITVLERMIIKDNLMADPLLIGNTYGIRVEATKPIRDAAVPNEAKRLFCIIEVEGVKMGSLELPISNGFVSGNTIKEAIDISTAWKILGKFFEYTFYRKSIREPTAMFKKYGVETVEEYHEKYGWAHFLQQFWNRPSWPGGRFYHSNFWKLKRAKKISSDKLSNIEIVNALPNIFVTDDKVKIQIRLAGIEIGSVDLHGKNKRVKAKALQVKITQSYGLELCRVCVQQALVGKPINEMTTLRQRLLQAIKARDTTP